MTIHRLCPKCGEAEPAEKRAALERYRREWGTYPA